MRNRRIIRINELLKREIAQALYREMSDVEMDLSSVTITRAAVSADLRRARIGVSVRGGDAEWASVLRFLNLHRPAIQEAIHRDLILKYTPVLVFERDMSLAEGDRVLRLIEALPPAEPAAPRPPPSRPEAAEPDELA
jgi:ribosome-binding factor A